MDSNLVNMKKLFFEGRFEALPEQPVVLNLSMHCSPFHIIFLIIALLFWIVAIGSMNLPMIFGAAAFTIITQAVYYQTARPALEHLLNIVGGEFRD